VVDRVRRRPLLSTMTASVLVAIVALILVANRVLARRAEACA
jgi:predicted nicotinamide N-methyase